MPLEVSANRLAPVYDPGRILEPFPFLVSAICLSTEALAITSSARLFGISFALSEAMQGTAGRSGVQKIAKRAWLSPTWQRHQRSAPLRDGRSLPMPEGDTRIGPRCVCSSPSVMWEGEYFCVVTGDLSDKCSLAVRALLCNNDESEYSIQQS